MIRYTHMWSLLYKLAGFMAAIGLTVVFASILQRFSLLFGSYFSTVETISGLAVFFGSAMALAYLTAGVDDFLYFRLSLGIPLTLTEARQCAFLLEPQDGNYWFSSRKWRTFDEIVEYPKGERKAILFELAKTASRPPRL